MKKFSLILLTALATLFTPATALADGMVISPPNYYVNENEQKAIIWHDGKTETLILSIIFTGNAADFGWIIPVPAKPEVDKSTDVLFTALEELTRPEVSIQPLRNLDVMEFGSGALEKAPVTVWETKKVDIYDISVVSSTESDALARWFNEHNYSYPKSQSYILDEYVQKGWFFVAAKIDTEKLGSYVEGQLREGHATPLKITFTSDKIVYPLKISSITGEHLTSDIVKTFSFENGTTEGWRDGFIAGDCRATVTSEESYHGIFSLKVPNCNTGTKNIVSHLLAGLTKGRNYVFSAYVKGYTVDSRIGSVSLETLSSGELISVGSPEIYEWIRFELPFTASSNSQKISIVGDGFTKGNGFYADAIQIELGTEATDFGQTGSGVRGISEEMDRRIPSISPIEPGFMPPRPRPNQVPILLYIFSDHKVSYPGFNTQWASWVKGKTIEKLASDEEGEPWMKTSKKMYLTKLWNSMSLAEMTDDLIIKDADDNKPINAPEFFELTSWKFLVLFGILAAEVIGVGVFWYYRRRN